MRIDNSVRWFWVPAVVLILILGIWCHRRREDKPSDPDRDSQWQSASRVSAFALGLWGLSRLLGPLMQSLGVRLAVAAEADPTLRQLVPLSRRGYL